MQPGSLVLYRASQSVRAEGEPRSELSREVPEVWIPKTVREMMVMMKGWVVQGDSGSGRKNRRKVVSNPSTRGRRGMTHHQHHHDHHQSVEDRT